MDHKEWYAEELTLSSKYPFVTEAVMDTNTGRLVAFLDAAYTEQEIRTKFAPHLYPVDIGNQSVELELHDTYAPAQRQKRETQKEDITKW